MGRVMKTKLIRAVCLSGFLLSILSGAQAASYESDQLALGIDRSGTMTLRPDEVEKTVQGVRALHATWFRDGPNKNTSPQGVAKFVNVMRQAKQQGLKVLVIINPQDADFDNNNEGAAKNTCGWTERRLSAVNPVLFTQRLHNLFDALKAANVDIDAFEIGNEEDSHCYNADIPADHIASPQEVMFAAHGYGEFLKTAALVIRDPHYFPQAKIITFGMTHSSTPVGAITEPARFVAMLRNINGFNYLDNAWYHVDGYGTHIYAAPNNVMAGASARLREDAAALGRDKPFWVTEFGFLHSASFANQGVTAGDGVQQYFNLYRSMAREMPMGPIMFYSYDSWLTDDSGNFLPLANVIAAYGATQR